MSEPNAAPHPDGEELPRDSHADEPDAQDVEPADAPEPPDEPTTSGDADDTVVGMVTTNSADETTSNSATVEITLGACPGDGLDLGDPLPDGTYVLRLYGIIDPTDHAHAQAENWVAEPLTVTVADGTARLG